MPRIAGGDGRNGYAPPVAEPLKNAFQRPLVVRLAATLAAVEPSFPSKRFVADATRGFDDLELLDRGRQVGRALGAHLPQDFARAVDVLVASLGPRLGQTAGNGMEPFFYLPHVLFVSDRGVDRDEHFEPSMRAQYELTQRFTAEFSIRAFLERHPERTLARLAEWTRDPSEHVRRLVSEGTRPRLPWAPRLRALQRDPAPILPLLESLRDDPSDYVRRSVANNLNDIAKDHPALTVEVCARWMDGAPALRQALVRHALRTLIKAGDRGALAVLGFGESRGLRVAAHITPKRVAIGGQTRVEVTVENPTRKRQRAVVDLAVDFVKQSKTSRKVFKLRAVDLAPGESVTLGKTLSFAPMTTRTPYPGRHALGALVDGVEHALGFVDVRA